MQTASGTAESDVSGVYMNMVTKSGGNRFTSDHNIYFMNDALQGNNVDDELRARLGLQPARQTGAAGNPIDISYDWSSTLGGPIKRDKAWFFGALRWWRLDQFQIGALNRRWLAGHRRQPHPQLSWAKPRGRWPRDTRTSFMFNRNLKYRFHRRERRTFIEDKATVLQDQPAQNYVAQINHGPRHERGRRRALRPDVGRVPDAATRTRCGRPTSRIRDISAQHADQRRE